MEGLRILEIMVSKDERGVSERIYTDGEVADFTSSELFVSVSKRNVIRGMHFQPYPYGQKKIVSVLKGSIEGVVLDLRPNSKTYMGFQTVHLSEDCGKAVLVPEYCAWGFHALEEENILIYNISGEYRKEYDQGIKWDSFGYGWKTVDPIISERDRRLESLEEYCKGVRDNEKNKMPVL